MKKIAFLIELEEKLKDRLNRQACVETGKFKKRITQVDIIKKALRQYFNNN